MKIFDIFRLRTIFPTLVLLSAVNVTLAQTRGVALKEVIDAEMRFSDRAAASDTRTAFLEFAADSGVIFNRQPENAKQSWTKRQPNNSLFEWRPARADVSASGKLGYTTGSWAFSRNRTETPVAWGEYFTIWKKQADGEWKFVLDLGVQHGKTKILSDDYNYTDAASAKKIKAVAPNEWTDLENKFAESLEKKGARKTYEKFAASEIRLLREGKMPFQGRQAALSAIEEKRIKFKVLGGEADSDFAYAYGEYESKNDTGEIEKGFYARVWKREAKNWRIAVEVIHLLPFSK